MSGNLAELLESALDRKRPSIRSSTGERLEPSAVLELAARVADDLGDRGLNSDEPVLVTIGNRPSDLGTLLGVWLA